VQESTPKVTLIILGAGPDFDSAQLREDLSACCVNSTIPQVIHDSTLPVAQQSAAAHKLVESDSRFQLVQVGADSSMLQFRLTGYRHYGISADDMSFRYAIDVEAMNVAYVQAVNLRGRTLLSYGPIGAVTDSSVSSPKPTVNARTTILRWSVGGQTDFSTVVWPVLQEEAARVLRSFFQKVSHRCPCGL